MYVFGVDIPLVELIVGMVVVGVIILLEITIILILITFHMRNSKRLESQIGRLSLSLMKLETEELKEIEKLKELEDKEESIIKRLMRFRIRPTEGKVAIKVTPKKKVKIKKRSKLLEAVDKILKRWKI